MKGTVWFQSSHEDQTLVYFNFDASLRGVVTTQPFSGDGFIRAEMKPGFATPLFSLFIHVLFTLFSPSFLSGLQSPGLLQCLSSLHPEYMNMGSEKLRVPEDTDFTLTEQNGSSPPPAHANTYAYGLTNATFTRAFPCILSLLLLKLQEL